MSTIRFFFKNFYPNIDKAHNKFKGYTDERRSLVPCTVQSVSDIFVPAGAFAVWIISLEQPHQTARDSATREQRN